MNKYVKAALVAANIACVGMMSYTFIDTASASVSSVDNQKLNELQARAEKLAEQNLFVAKAVTEIQSERPKPRPTKIQKPRPSLKPMTDMPQNAMSQMTDDVMCLAFNIYFEARGERGKTGQISIGNVTVNRTAVKYRKAKSICDTVYKSKQFSWTIYRPYIDLSTPAERTAFREAMILAMAVVDGQVRDYTNGALHYYNPDLANPQWKNAYQEVAVIGNHRFMR
jgi:spore germination cell wall hydrolase CwlJ-like protein